MLLNGTIFILYSTWRTNVRVHSYCIGKLRKRKISASLGLNIVKRP